MLVQYRCSDPLWSRGLLACCLLLAASVLGAQDTGSVNGKVFDGDGAPLPGVMVVLTGGAGQAVSGTDGTFKIDNVPAGNYRAMATLDGFLDQAGSVEVQAGSAASLEMAMGLSYIEAVVVRGERGDENVLERPMTVSGFNEEMVSELGMNNNNDLEALTPGLQMGHRAPASGHGNHIYIRGIGSQRNQEFFSDTAVATYVDGVYTDELYGLEPGNMFDVERMEIARGPQGTTGGRAAIAGSISYVTTKPTQSNDLNVMVEGTDQVTQRFNIAIGGPLAQSGFSWRLTGGVWTGDGAQANIGLASAYDEPDQVNYAPQLRYTNNRLDMNVRYSRVEDRGTPRSTVELFGRDTTTECLLEGTDPAGNPVCLNANPFFGAQNEAPSVANCDLTDPNQIICDSGDLLNIVDYNTEGRDRSELDMTVFDLNYQLGGGMGLAYKGAVRETSANAFSDIDGTSRVGSANDPFVAADNGGPFADNANNYNFLNEQTSHELSLSSSFAGPFQFVFGGFYREGDEPYDAKFFNYSSRTFNTDSFAACEAALPFFGLPLLSDFGTTSPESAIGVWSCPGALRDFSNTGILGPGQGSLGGNWLDFFGHSDFETKGTYFNAEYQLNNAWSLFGGARYDDDTKNHVQNDVRIGVDFGFAVDLWIFRNKDVEGFEPKRDANWSQLTWNAGIQYNPRPERMIYGRVSKGGRPGGFAGFGTFNQDDMVFDSEELINYEIGSKGLFADGKLQLSTTIFYNDYEKLWVNSQRLLAPEERVPGQNSAFGGELTTIGGSWTNGIEIEGAFRFTDRWTLRGFYNYLDSEIGDFETIYCCDTQAVDTQVAFTDQQGNTFFEDIPPISNFGGNQLPNQPHHKYSLTLVYDVPYSDSLGALKLLTTVGYTDTKHADISNLPRYFIPDYTRWDARAIWYTKVRGLEVHLFGKNLLDEIAVQQWRPIESAGGSPRGTLTDEREIGLQVIFRK